MMLVLVVGSEDQPSPDFKAWLLGIIGSELDLKQ